MPSFAVRHPYLIIVVCLFVCVLGLTSVVRMPVDMFPPINIPVVLVATFYSGMPPQQIEADITDTFERFFTLASGIDHMESRSMTGVSLIKIYFQPGTDANADVTQISNLAMADLRRLAAGNSTARGNEGRCVQPAGLSADRGGRGTQRNSTCTTTCNTRFETRSRAFRERRFRRPTAASTGRSWFTWIRSSCRRTN